MQDGTVTSQWQTGTQPADSARAPAETSLRQWFAAIGICAAIAVIGVMLHRFDIPLVDTLDKHIGDWRIALGTPKAATQRRDIAIVMITEETLLDYESRSPLDRGLLSELIRAVDAAGPKAIGIDMVFDRRTRADGRLITALRDAKAPIVLGSLDRRVAGLPDESLMQQYDFIAKTGRAHGHVMLARKDSTLLASDSVVRYIAPSLAVEPAASGSVVPAATRGSGPTDTGASAPVGSFVDVIVAAAGLPQRSTSRIIAWQRPPDDQTPLYTVLNLPRHSPEMLRPALEGVFLPSWREVLKDRIVLIGAAMVDRDQLLTPLSVMDRATVPGVMIQAQALAQRIDGNRDVRTLPDWLSAIVAGAVALACFMAARHAGVKPQGLGYGVAGVIVIGLLSFAAYGLFRIDFPSIALAVAWALGGFAGFTSSWIFHRLGVA